MKDKLKNTLIFLLLLSNILILYYCFIYNSVKTENKVKIENKEKTEDKWSLIENKDYNIPIYFKGFKAYDNINYLYYSMLYDDNKDYCLFKITDNNNFMSNPNNDLELSYNIDVLTKFKYDKEYMYRVAKYKEFFVDLGIREFKSKDEDPKCFGYFIMWSHKKEPKHEINENTDTLITNLEFKTIQKMYPKFQGKYIKSQVTKILIQNKTSFIYYYAFMNNINFIGDNYIEKIPLNYMKNFVSEADSVISAVNNKKYREYIDKYKRLEDYIITPDKNDFKGSTRFIEKPPLIM